MGNRSPLLELDLPALEQAIDEAVRELKNRKADARRRLRIIRLKEAGSGIAFWIVLGGAYVVIEMLLAVPLKADWRLLSQIAAGVVVVIALVKAETHPAARRPNEWLVRLQSEKRRLLSTLHDSGYEIAEMQRRADVLRSRQVEGSQLHSARSADNPVAQVRSESTERVEYVHPSDVLPSDHRVPLPDHLLRRVKLLHHNLSDVDSHSLAEWIDGFERDANPVSEVAWWETLERAYRRFLRIADIPEDKRKVAYDFVACVALGVPEADLAGRLEDLPDGSYQTTMHCLASDELG